MNLLRSGVDPAVMALWLGHANLRSVERYIHADMGIKERALARTAPTAPGRPRQAFSSPSVADGSPTTVKPCSSLGVPAGTCATNLRATPVSTAVYLTITPQLLAEAGRRFEALLTALASPTDRRWLTDKTKPVTTAARLSDPQAGHRQQPQQGLERGRLQRRQRLPRSQAGARPQIPDGGGDAGVSRRAAANKAAMSASEYR